MINKNGFNHYRRTQSISLAISFIVSLAFVLGIIFHSAVPPIPAPPTPPSVLVASPSNLSDRDSTCVGGVDARKCTITIKASQGSVHWQATSDMGNAVVFSPSNGMLQSGKSININISGVPCQDGAFIFNNLQNNISLAVVKWQCQPLEQPLEKSYHRFSLAVNDIQGLLKGLPPAVDDVKQQIRKQQILAGREVGLAIVYGGAPDIASIQTAQGIAKEIYVILNQLGREGFAFQHSSYYDPLYVLSNSSPLNKVVVDVYLVCNDAIRDQCS